MTKANSAGALYNNNLSTEEIIEIVNVGTFLVADLTSSDCYLLHVNKFIKFHTMQMGCLVTAAHSTYFIRITKIHVYIYISNQTV